MKAKWYLCVVALALPAVGAVSAQPRSSLLLAMPAVATASAPAPGSVTQVSVPAPGAVDAVAVRRAIEGANSRWLAAFRTGDSESLARIYAPDASLFPPSNVSLEGRDSIVEYFGKQRSAGMGEASLKTLDVVCVGDVAYEVGMYGFRFNDGSGGVPGDAGRYFAIWKSQPDGSWRYQVGIWSSNRDALARN